MVFGALVPPGWTLSSDFNSGTLFSEPTAYFCNSDFSSRGYIPCTWRRSVATRRILESSVPAAHHTGEVGQRPGCGHRGEGGSRHGVPGPQRGDPEDGDLSILHSVNIGKEQPLLPPLRSPPQQRGCCCQRRFLEFRRFV